MTRERLIAYVDGFNLYHGIHDKWRRKYLWLDLEALVRSLRPRSDLVGVRYFTAPVLNDPAAASRQSDYVAALTHHSQGLISVTQGRYQTKSCWCSNCRTKHLKNEEKETDVNIAVSLVEDAVRDQMDAALLISADSDMVPAIKAAWSLKPDLFVAAAFPPKRHSAELKTLMPSSFHIGQSHIRKCQLPETIKDGSGTTWTRPAKWA